jgi:transcription elongation factor GreB
VAGQPNYITPAGYRRLREEYEALYAGERPKLVETISWAASNGDRSENGDYLYGKKKLREIDRRIDWLARRMKDARVTDPAAQPDRDRV